MLPSAVVITDDGLGFESIRAVRAPNVSSGLSSRHRPHVVFDTAHPRDGLGRDD